MSPIERFAFVCLAVGAGLRAAVEAWIAWIQWCDRRRIR